MGIRTIIGKSHWGAFAFGAAVCLAVTSLFPHAIPTAGVQAKAQWVVTGQLTVPGGKGKSTFRLEDTELKVVCYTEYLDLSGAMSCVKR